MTKPPSPRFIPGILALFCLVLPPAAGADFARDLREADAALAAGDYEQAYQAYLHHAGEQANPLAEFNLALFHDNGWGRPVDPVAACDRYAKAAAGGIPFAAHRWARCLADGVGRPADAGAAARWYREAADLGHYGSWCDLGELYLRGQGVEKDPRQGLALCTRGAEKGVVHAQMRLAELYLGDDPALGDMAEGARWLEAAGHQGVAEAQYRLGRLLEEQGDGAPATLAAARGWLETAAGQGHLPAYLPVAELYLATPPDPATGRLPATALAKAYLWLSAAVQRLEEGNPRARAEGRLAEVRDLMPQTWAPALDAKVEAHLAEFTPPR